MLWNLVRKRGDQVRELEKRGGKREKKGGQWQGYIRGKSCLVSDEGDDR